MDWTLKTRNPHIWSAMASCEFQLWFYCILWRPPLRENVRTIVPQMTCSINGPSENLDRFSVWWRRSARPCFAHFWRLESLIDVCTIRKLGHYMFSVYFIQLPKTFIDIDIIKGNGLMQFVLTKLLTIKGGKWYHADILWLHCKGRWTNLKDYSRFGLLLGPCVPFRTLVTFLVSL